MDAKQLEASDVIYKPGNLHLQSVVLPGGRVAYSGGGKRDDLTVDEYFTERGLVGQGFEVMPFSRALALIGEAEQAAYLRPWVEIDEAAYDAMLGALPPEKWQTVDGVNIFRMSEYLSGNITAHYARIAGRHFTANRRTSANYTDLAAEVRAFMSEVPRLGQLPNA